MTDRIEADAIIVGGGAYGCVLACHLRAQGARRVILLEREPEVSRRASYANQARVHRGYHYPRSYVTALRSRVNFPRFVDEYRDCIVDSFDGYYAVSRSGSKVTAGQFASFCERIGAPLGAAPPAVLALFDPNWVEGVFRVDEWVFDADRLRTRLRARLDESGVDVRTGTEALRVARQPDGRIELSYRASGEQGRMVAPRVFNCTYSRINRLLVDSGLKAVPLKHELAELALVEVPAVLEGIGITVMCGPFFSLMPFPPRGLHTLSHVRYTPHHAWSDQEGDDYRDPYDHLARSPRETKFEHMVHDAQRFVPAIARSVYRESLWEVKTILPTSEIDDGRPILMQPAPDMAGLTSVMGSKIDNVYEMIDALDGVGAAGSAD